MCDGQELACLSLYAISYLHKRSFYVIILILFCIHRFQRDLTCLLYTSRYDDRTLSLCVAHKHFHLRNEELLDLAFVDGSRDL